MLATISAVWMLSSAPFRDQIYVQDEKEGKKRAKIYADMYHLTDVQVQVQEN